MNELLAAADPRNTYIGHTITGVGGLVRTATTILVALSLLAFFWGLFKFLFQSGSKDGVSQGKNLMVWGIIALFVMVSIGGLINLLDRTFGFQQHVTNTTTSGV